MVETFAIIALCAIMTAIVVAALAAATLAIVGTYRTLKK